MTAHAYDLHAYEIGAASGHPATARLCPDCKTIYDRTVTAVCPLCDGGDALPTDAGVLEKRRELEARAGVDPLDALQARRAEIVKKLAPLRAKYGPGGTWDAERKVMLALAATTLRDEYAERGVKITEARLDEEAHASKRYRDFLDGSTAERATWVMLEDEYQQIEWTYHRGQGLLRFASAERAA